MLKVSLDNQLLKDQQDLREALVWPVTQGCLEDQGPQGSLDPLEPLDRTVRRDRRVPRVCRVRWGPQVSLVPQVTRGRLEAWGRLEHWDQQVAQVCLVREV